MKRTMTVVGSGTMRVAPDVARLQLGVQLTAPTAVAASQQASQAMTAIIAALQAQQLAENDIQTGHFAITQEFFHSGDAPPRRTGYTASNMAQVTIRALDTVGVVIDAVLGAGGEQVQINGLSFFLSDPTATQALAQARTLALADARMQAAQIAHEMGVTLGKPRQIRTGKPASRPNFQPPGMSFLTAMPSTIHPIEAGQMEITDQVEVVFAIN